MDQHSQRSEGISLRPPVRSSTVSYDDLNRNYDDAEETLVKWDEEGPENGFEVKHHDHARHDKLRPLVIVVHPGGMIEAQHGWGGAEWKAVNKFSRRNQAGLARELSAWRTKYDADIAILHRGSCSQFLTANANSIDEDLQLELLVGWQRGSVLLGDHLDDAAAWMIENLHIADRPRIFLGGAYSDFDQGCLTAIGRALEKVVGPGRIKVSKYSPPGSSHDAGKVWRPGNQALDFKDAR